jgi:SAM-dependent methyltransferase
MHRQHIESHYLPRIHDTETNSAILDWESVEAQELRFDALIRSIDLSGKSLLDVGCGLGDLHTFLTRRGIKVDYLGIDLLPEMISTARLRNPGVAFRDLDLFRNPDSIERTFDVVFCSGIFNLNLGNNHAFLEEALEVFFRLANEAVVFNLLHKRSPDPDHHYFYFTPDEVIPKVWPYSDDIRILDDYLANDFTVAVRLNRK